MTHYHLKHTYIIACLHISVATYEDIKYTRDLYQFIVLHLILCIFLHSFLLEETENMTKEILFILLLPRISQFIRDVTMHSEPVENR